MIQSFRELLLVAVKWESIEILKQCRNITIIIKDMSFSYCTNGAKYIVNFSNLRL